MPELPEVETVVRTLTPLLVGKTVLRISHARPDMLHPAGMSKKNALDRKLAGRKITRIDRRGKRILIRLDNDTTLYIHLGMTGQLTVESAREDCKPHTHLIVDLANSNGARCRPQAQLRFCDPRRFGGVWHLPKGDPGESLGAGRRPMGPEPLTLGSKELAVRLSATTRAIKVALLDQQLIAGIGNIYADEALHAAGIHPATPANLLSAEQVRHLGRAIKLVLKKAIKHGGSSLRDYVDAEGRPGAAQKLHLVYDREDAPCRRCRTPIVRIVLGGRSTHFCPTCVGARHASPSDRRAGHASPLSKGGACPAPTGTPARSAGRSSAAARRGSR